MSCLRCSSVINYLLTMCKALNLTFIVANIYIMFYIICICIFDMIYNICVFDIIRMC